MPDYDASRDMGHDHLSRAGIEVGAAHTYAELESRLLELREELKFSALGRVVAEVIIARAGEPRLSFGEHQLPAEHALKLAAWIRQVFQRD